MKISSKLTKPVINKALEYISKNPEENAINVLNLVDKVAGNGPNSYVKQRAAFREVLENPDNNMYKLIMSIFRDIDNDVVKATFENFILNANIFAWPELEANREKYNCNIPWAILMDPTSACNLKCTGCWAAEYGNKMNLSFDEIDSIITQGKELGVHMYIYTGGEPLVRKDDLIKICEKHSDCQFLSFTNATLIDEAFADEMLRVKNFVPAISVEGSEEATDERRGQGTYKKVVKAMNLLREKKLPFGVSCCYTSHNLDSVTSDEYVDQMIEWGAKFVWFFHYMPVGSDAVTELLPSPEQRKQMYRRSREIRKTKPIFAMDFQNDGEYVGGCIAGGRRYMHINANGDVDPCVFIHYSNSNIRKNTILEALQSPIFMEYHNRQPFNENHLQPCPMLENPDILREMVAKTGAHSTDFITPETADELCCKCDRYASAWAPEAKCLWEESGK